MGKTTAGQIHGMLDPYGGGKYAGGDLFGWDYDNEDPYSGMAAYPSYVGMDQQNLAGMFSGPNAPLNKFTQESMRNGPSEISKFALKQNAMGATAGRDQARRLASGMAQDQQARLSMKGGLGAGAGERINKYSTNVGMDAANAVDANAGGNRANILVADEGARVGNLGQAANLQQGQTAFKYGMANDDANRRQQELNRQNAFNMNNYNTQMQAWGAGKQAAATAQSGQGGKK